MSAATSLTPPPDPAAPVRRHPGVPAPGDLRGAHEVERFTNNGRPEEVSAAMADPDRVRVTRAFEVNP